MNTATLRKSDLYLSDRPSDPSAQPPIKILVVDDNQNDRVLYATQLHSSTNHTYQIDEALDSDMAIAMLRERVYDCVLVDTLLPEKTGLECINLFQQACRDARPLHQQRLNQRPAKTLNEPGAQATE